MDFSQLLQQKQRRWQRAALIMLVLLLVASAAYVMVGEIFISPFSAMSPLEQQLVVELRLPRLVAAMVIGAALAVSGQRFRSCWAMSSLSRGLLVSQAVPVWRW